MQKTANRKVYRVEDVKDRIEEAIATIVDPVVSTLGLNGGTALYQDDGGNNIITSDGVTIARHITVSDPLQDSIIDIIKEGSIRTNNEAGDGTTTTVLFANNLIYKCWELMEQGFSRQDIYKALDKSGDYILDNLNVREMTDEMMLPIALVSAGNDEEIAGFTTQAVKSAGLHGLISITQSTTLDTEIEESLGHILDVGVDIQELYADVSRPQMKLDEIPVIIIDNKTYYEEDAEHIIRTATKAGMKGIVVFAKDFGGDSVNTFVTNHVGGKLNISLIKIDNEVIRRDLATYLGCETISEAKGKTISQITEDDFVLAKSVFTNPQRTVIENNGKTNKPLESLIKELNNELKENKGDKSIERRLGYLSSGIVTIKVGGGTQPEVREKIFRYEDSINAVRNAMQYGYVAGGGVGIRDAYFEAHEKNDFLETESALIQTLGFSTLWHLFGKDKLDETRKDFGIDLRTGVIVDMIDEGIVEPLRVAQMTILNAISVTKMIISLDSLIVYDYDKEKRCCEGE